MKYKEIVKGEYYESDSSDELTFPFYSFDAWGMMHVQTYFELVIDETECIEYEI